MDVFPRCLNPHKIILGSSGTAEHSDWDRRISSSIQRLCVVMTVFALVAANPVARTPHESLGFTPNISAQGIASRNCIAQGIFSFGGGPILVTRSTLKSEPPQLGSQKATHILLSYGCIQVSEFDHGSNTEDGASSSTTTVNVATECRSAYFSHCRTLVE